MTGPRKGELCLPTCDTADPDGDPAGVGLVTGLAYIRFLVQSEKSLFAWKPFRSSTARRDLVEARSSRQAFWRRSIKSIPDDLPPSEFISKEVDPILDKISAHGIQSLTLRERQILEAARAKMGKR